MPWRQALDIRDFEYSCLANNEFMSKDTVVRTTSEKKYPLRVRIAIIIGFPLIFWTGLIIAISQIFF